MTLKDKEDSHRGTWGRYWVLVPAALLSRVSEAAVGLHIGGRKKSHAPIFLKDQTGFSFPGTPELSPTMQPATVQTRWFLRVVGKVTLIQDVFICFLGHWFHAV